MKLYRFTLLLFVGVATLAMGFAPTATAQYRDARRPDIRPPDARRVLDVWLPTSRRAHPVVYTRVNRDASRYVRSLDRWLRLDRRQERRIYSILTDRAYERVTRRAGRDRNRAYPFPRDARDRKNKKWWKKTDRRIERVLDRRQRRAYREFVRQHKRVRDRDRDRHREHRRDRDRHDDWYDDDWDD